MKKCVFVLLIMMLAAVAGCSFPLSSALQSSEPSGPPSLSDAAMYSDISSDPVETFPQGTVEIIALCRISNAKDDTTITFTWYSNGFPVDSIIINTDGQSRRYYSSYTLDPCWPSGTYYVEMYIDDNDEPDAIVEFTVE